MKLKEYIGKKEDIRKRAILSFAYNVGSFHLNSAAERKRSILNSYRNKQKARNTVQKSISSGMSSKPKSSGISLRKTSSSFKSYSPSKSSFRSSSSRSSRR